MKKSKIIMICAAMLASVSLISLTACSPEEPSVSSAVESSVISETSASLGIYAHDTDNDGTLDIVVDKYGTDISKQYQLKEDGIYEGETLLVAIENVQTYVPVDEIAFTIESKTVHPDTEFTLDVVFLPNDATCMEYDLTVDNTEVLQVENGIVTALANGEATVTATAKAGGITASCQLVVNAEVEETEEQNEQAAASGGTVTSSNTSSNKNNTTVNTNTTTNTQTTTNNNTTYTPPSNGNTNNGGSINTNTTPAQPEIPVQPQVHAPIYTQQWVVDQAAWTEERPVYTMVPVMVCNDCGAYLHINQINPWEHIENHALNGGKGSWTDKYEKQQTGTESIYHEEVGHWESVLVCGGCTGTH